MYIVEGDTGADVVDTDAALNMTDFASRLVNDTDTEVQSLHLPNLLNNFTSQVASNLINQNYTDDTNVVDDDTQDVNHIFDHAMINRGSYSVYDWRGNHSYKVSVKLPQVTKLLVIMYE